MASLAIDSFVIDHVPQFKDARDRLVALLGPYMLYLLRRLDIVEAESLRVMAQAFGPGERVRVDAACPTERGGDW